MKMLGVIFAGLALVNLQGFAADRDTDVEIEAKTAAVHQQNVTINLFENVRGDVGQIVGVLVTKSLMIASGMAVGYIAQSMFDKFSKAEKKSGKLATIGQGAMPFGFTAATAYGAYQLTSHSKRDVIAASIAAATVFTYQQNKADKAHANMHELPVVAVAQAK